MSDTPAPPATLKDQLAVLIAAHEAKEDRQPGSLVGWDWFQLSNAEEAVFQIDRDRFPRMVMTWYCYEAFKLVHDSPEWDDTP